MALLRNAATERTFSNSGKIAKEKWSAVAVRRNGLSLPVHVMQFCLFDDYARLSRRLTNYELRITIRTPSHSSAPFFFLFFLIGHESTVIHQKNRKRHLSRTISGASTKFFLVEVRRLHHFCRACSIEP